MKVDQDLDTEVTSPADGGVEVRSSTGDIRRVGVVVCPVADWNADQVEARVADFLHVAVLEPVVPVLNESRVGILEAGL